MTKDEFKTGQILSNAIEIASHLVNENKPWMEYPEHIRVKAYELAIERLKAEVTYEVADSVIRLKDYLQ